MDVFDFASSGLLVINKLGFEKSMTFSLQDLKMSCTGAGTCWELFKTCMVQILIRLGYLRSS